MISVVAFSEQHCGSPAPYNEKQKATQKEKKEKKPNTPSKRL
jgi:hypothetical protein